MIDGKLLLVVLTISVPVSSWEMKNVIVRALILFSFGINMNKNKLCLIYLDPDYAFSLA